MALRRYIVLGQETETIWCPDWYVDIKAAEYLNCKPWELAEVPMFWKRKALIGMTAEHQAAEIKREHK